MKREYSIGLLLLMAFILLILPLVFNYGLSPQYVSNSSIYRFNNNTGVALSYYASIFGGLVGGIFTYAGVKLSLDSQDKLTKHEADSHKKAFLHQLKYSYKLITALDAADEERNGKKTRVGLHLLVFDKGWYTHLPYIKWLTQDELEEIAFWFYMLDGIEMQARKSEHGELCISEVKNKYHKNTDNIKSIIDRLESDNY